VPRLKSCFIVTHLFNKSIAFSWLRAMVSLSLCVYLLQR
jgi:hypothetical protein